LIQLAKFQKVNVIRKNNNNAAIDDNYLKLYQARSKIHITGMLNYYILDER